MLEKTIEHGFLMTCVELAPDLQKIYPEKTERLAKRRSHRLFDFLQFFSVEIVQDASTRKGGSTRISKVPLSSIEGEGWRRR